MKQFKSVFLGYAKSLGNFDVIFHAQSIAKNCLGFNYFLSMETMKCQ